MLHSSWTSGINSKSIWGREVLHILAPRRLDAEATVLRLCIGGLVGATRDVVLCACANVEMGGTDIWRPANHLDSGAGYGATSISWFG